MNRNKLKYYINRFKRFDVPKYIKDELLTYALRNVPSIKIKNKYYAFTKDGTLKNVKENGYYITSKKKKYNTVKVCITKLYEYKELIVERAFGIELSYNGSDYNFRVGFIGAKILDFNDMNYYIFKIGVHSGPHYYTSFHFDNSYITKSQVWLDEYKYSNYLFKRSKTYLYNLKNKYLREYSNISAHDVRAISLFPKLETCYKVNGELTNDRLLSYNLIKLFIKGKLKLRPKIFIKHNIRSLEEYIICYNYPKLIFKDTNKYDFIYFYELLKQGLDFKYLYKNFNDLDIYKDYLNYRNKNDLSLPLYPTNLIKAHDDILITRGMMDVYYLENEINEVVKLNKYLEFNDDGYKFYIPNIRDMLTYSKDLNLCIKSCGYIERVAKHNTLLMFCEKIDNPSKLEKFAGEVLIDKNRFDIIQFHGFNNDKFNDDEYINRRQKILEMLNHHLNEVICNG